MRCDGARPCARCEKTSTLCEYDEKITQSRRQSSQPAVQTLSSSIPNLHEEERRLSTSSDKHSEANCQCDIYQRRIHDLEAQLHVLKQERDRNIVKTETCLEDGKKQTQSAGQEKSASSRINLLEPLEMPSGSEAETVTIMSPTSNISFANDLYAYIRSHPPSVRANQARAYISDTRLPPLMFDFYNLSSQPHTIWMAFVTFMRQWSQKQQQQHHGPSNTKNEHISKLPVPDNLGCEMLKLHTCHNYLYSAFIDTSNATNKQTASNWKSKLSEKPFLKTQSAASGCDETMLVYAIFANVFLCASQSLSISAPDIAELSRQCSEVYYHQAYRIFTTNVFPASHPAHPAEPIMEQLSILAKTSVLLTHYQCATLSEEQAFLTFKIGLTFAERLGLHKLSTHIISQQQFTQFYNAEVDDARRLWITADKVNTEEYERLCNLWKVISGWDVWFAIYLDRPPMVDDMPRDIPKILPPSKRIEPRDWAMQVVNVYIDSMRTILRSPSSGSCAQLKSKLDKLKAWSSSFMAKQRKGVERSTNESSIHLPASILSLYHDILTIQLYRSKALPALKFFGDAAGWVPSKQKPNSGSKRRMDTEPESPKPVTIDEAGKKDQSKEDLVAKKVVDTTLNHIEVTETSGPSETKVAAACCTVAARNIVETATRIISTDRHCAGAPVVLYPLCLAGTVLIWQYHQRSRSSHLGKHGRSEGAEQDTSGLLVLDDGEFTRVLSSFKQLTRDISKSFPVAEKVLNVLNEMLGTNTVIDLSSDPTSIADAPSNELSYMVNQQTHQQQQMRHQMNMMLQPEWIPEFQPDGIIDMHPSLIQDPLFSNQRHSIGSFPPPNYTHMDVLNFSGRREMDREAIGKLDRDYRDSVAATNAYTNQSAHMLVLSSQLPMNFAMNQTMYDEQISNFSNKKSPTTARETPDFTTTTKTPLRTPATPKANQQWSRQMWLQHQRQQVNGQFSFDVYNSQLVAEKNNSKKQRVESSYDDIPDNNGESIMKNEFATFTEMTAADQPVDFGVYPSELNPFLMSDPPMNHQHTHATSSDPAGLTLQHNNNAYSQRAQHLTHQRSVSQDTPPTPHPYITNAAMASTPHTKLPLPAPKQTHVIQKSWPTTTSSREFLARFNVVETLHPAHPIASSDVSYMGTNLVDPTTMSVVPPPSSSTQQQGLTDQHQEMVLSTF
ncbi:hypothetical protein INT44_008304 [Umbelopsis vinacea]|uniref:Zn(2)-C6 fungal-type domain-containing protein n=1 Tax=Umbelopsis vinacea TaxID=44442 RepID=A0A8H7UDD2_9FUNG|nr:hypothetical protein INT44_008304 [Umbelopsis vinacea]